MFKRFIKSPEKDTPRLARLIAITLGSLFGLLVVIIVLYLATAAYNAYISAMQS